MSNFTLSARSRKNLNGVHADLVKVVERAIQITPVDFMVIEGLRTVNRQRQLVAKGASKTMNSRHLTGHAVDLVPLVNGKVSWSWPHYYPLEKAVKQAAKELGVPIEWGGDWRSFKDGPHWQLPWKKYPKGSSAQYAKLPKEVTSAPEYTDETEQSARNKAVATAAGGAATGAAVAAEPVAEIADAVVWQQGELTSGSMVRVAIAVAVVGLAVFIAWRKLR